MAQRRPRSKTTKRPGKPARLSPALTALRSKLIKQAREALSRRHVNDAESALNALLKKFKDGDAEAYYLLAVAAQQRDHFRDTAKFARKSLALNRRPEPMLILASVHRADGETDQCAALCDEALRMDGQLTRAKVLKAAAFEDAGRFDDAEAILEPLLASNANDTSPVGLSMRELRAKLLVQRKQYAQALTAIDELLETPKLPEHLRGSLHYLRAKSCDRAQDFAGSWASASIANQVGRLEFDPQLYHDQVSTLIDVWSAENVRRFPLSRCTSEVPIFIAGMPRSGTSLIDQIIDAHPAAAGVGELNSIERFATQLAAAFDPDAPIEKWFGQYDDDVWTNVAQQYVAQLRTAAPDGVERVVNKALGNNKLLGLISRLFPNTRIIHAIRDPRDVAISCFMGGFNNRLHPWTTNVDWAAAAWAESQRMMQHWKDTLDISILDVHYEKLVADPETEFPRLIEFLGLPWDDRCFDFFKSKRTVRTLSYDQVNRPLYTTSAGRHRNYQEQIKHVQFPEYAL